MASPIVVLLAGAVLVALAFGEQLEAVAIAAVLVVNTAIGFWTEKHALRSMEGLRVLGRVQATVRRSGISSVVAADDLVPGDIVLLDAGDVLTADLRLVSASGLQVDEATLTGESLAVEKTVAPCAAEAALADRTAMVFKGTAVTNGSAEGVVVATGMATELGRISQLVEQAQSEATPLEVRLARLGHHLILFSLVIAAFVAATNIWAGRGLYLSIEIALALAVAAVPEGLPIVATMALARGMWRMAGRNALVERLSAVETLGSTSVILTDKTGTLTENRMVVAELALPGEAILSLEPGRKPSAIPLSNEATVDPEQQRLLRDALRVAVLCNNAELAPEDARNETRATGDPTEVALLVAGRDAGLERNQLLVTTPELEEIAFDPEGKRMATLHSIDGGVLAAVKGAPETVIPCCAQYRTTEGGVEELDAAAQAEWIARAALMAARGQRVLALATKELSLDSAFCYEALNLVGLVALVDPPRDGVGTVIDDCRAAGMRVVMVTGDHGGTAWHVARVTGLIDADQAESVSSLDARTIPRFDNLSDSETQQVLSAPVIARATPKQKLELISLYQNHGAVVAMTGDGVNDAPALKKADIGVAMGKRGTQVAREAADMVLQDDEFGTIVAAITEGRAIFVNIRKFVLYLMSCNVSEILVVAVASFTQGPLPLLPLQILFLNLITDVFPALALGVGEGSPTLMTEPPRKVEEPLITRRQWGRIFGFAAVIALSVLAALLIAIEVLGKTGRQATTISFLTLALAQLWHVLNMRERGSRWWRNEITANPWIWGALLLCVALVAVAVHWAPLAATLKLSDPGADGWGLALLMSLLPLLAGQLWLVAVERMSRDRASESTATPKYRR